MPDKLCPNWDMMTSSSGNIFPRYWPFVRGIHRSPVNSPHKGQWRGALMFSLICARINGWVNNGKAGDLRRHRVHYDVTVMDTCGETVSFDKPLRRTNDENFRPQSRSILHPMALQPMRKCCICNVFDFVTSPLISLAESGTKRGTSLKDHHSGWIPRTKASDAELWCFLWSAPE